MLTTLVLLRHAKTEAGSASQGDKARCLVPRGMEATQIMGSYLRRRGFMPQLVLCSTAQRTVDTLAGIERAYGRPLPVQYVDALYLASAGEILNVVAAQVPEGIHELMVVGHNPGIHELSLKLAARGDEALIDRLALKFPTCASATFNCRTADWANLRHSECELTDFATPKLLGQVIDS
jgi:phosphohistidine phosphatase